jgi:SepF-like predicted cell division protein (DUF552 family)
MGGWFFKKKEGKKEEALPPLPKLKPEQRAEVGLTPSPLRSEVEHIRPVEKPMPEEKLPEFEMKLPEFPKEEMRPWPVSKEKPKELPSFPEIKKPEAELFEEESVYEVGKEIEELKERIPLRPVFVEVEKFKETLDDLNSAKVALKEGADVIAKLEEIRFEKDKAFEKWKSQLEDIQRKLIFVDKTLFEIKYV